MLFDQITLALLSSPTADDVFASTNLWVWVVLVFELISEVLVWPEGVLAFTPEPAALPVVCYEWNLYDKLMMTTKETAQAADVRTGSITELEYTNVRDLSVVREDGSNIVVANTPFSATAWFDHSTTIEIASGSSV